MAYGQILGQTTPGIGAAIVSGVVNTGETINAGDVVNVNQAWSVDLSTAQAGDIVNLPENGVMVPFYVASLDYEPTLNTSGTRVLLVRKDVYQNGQWNASNVNTYAGSTIDTWFNSTYKPMLDSKVLAEIVETLESIEKNGKPTVIVATTIKGKGYSKAEGVGSYHFWSPTPEEMAEAEQENAELIARLESNGN